MESGGRLLASKRSCVGKKSPTSSSNTILPSMNEKNGNKMSLGRIIILESKLY